MSDTASPFAELRNAVALAESALPEREFALGQLDALLAEQRSTVARVASLDEVTARDLVATENARRAIVRLTRDRSTAQREVDLARQALDSARSALGLTERTERERISRERRLAELRAVPLEDEVERRLRERIPTPDHPGLVRESLRDLRATIRAEICREREIPVPEAPSPWVNDTAEAITDAGIVRSGHSWDSAMRRLGTGR